MSTIVTVEIVCAVFLAILLITQTAEHSRTKSSRYLRLCILLVLCTLVVDAIAYVCMDDTTPFVFRYFICLLAYAGEGICFLCFAGYSEAVFAEKTDFNPWIFRVFKIAEIVWIAATAAAFISGKMVIFENGVEVADNGYPAYLLVSQIALLFYIPAMALHFRKELGTEAVILLSSFNIAPVIGILVALFEYYDYSYALDAIVLVFISEFLQKKQVMDQQAENEKHRILTQNNSRIMALEDSFESLYDVDLETGKYEVFIKGQTYGDITSKIVYLDDFFADTLKNTELVVYPADRAEIIRIMNKDYIRDALSRSTSFDTYYRLLADGNPLWVKMRILYKDETKRNIIVGVFNAEEEMQRIDSRRRMNMIYSLSDEYDPIIIIDPESGEYNWFEGKAEDVERNTPMSRHGDNVYEFFEPICKTIIHEEDKAQFGAFYTRENMMSIAETGVSQETENRWWIADAGSYLWKYNKAVRMIDESGKVYVVVGVIDTTKAKEIKKEIEDSSKLIESVAGIYRFAFAVDMSGSYFKVIRMDDEVRNALPMSEFTNYKYAIAPLFGWIHPGDKERMERELGFDTVREKLKHSGSYNVEYRVLNNGATEWHEMNVTHIAGDEIAMGFAENDLEITKRHIEGRRFNDCFGLYEADVDTGLMKVVVNSPYYTFSETGDAVPYETAMKKFAESQVGETREAFLNLADIGWVVKTLAKDNRHSFSYYSVTAGNTWVDVTCYVTMRHEDGTPAMFALEYSFVSSTGAVRQEMQKRLNESSQIISGLASGYIALYYMNIDEGTFSVHSLDSEKYPETNRIVRDGTDPFEMLRTFGTSDLVYPDDRYLFADMSAETFRERLEGQKRFSIRFRRAEGDGYIWIEMDAVKYEAPDDRANAIVVGFTDCDEEIRRDLEQQRRLEEALSMAETASNAKTEFLFNMSHDIRTPMNAILGYTDIALNHIHEPERMSDSLKKIKTSSGHLLQLINDILEMSRIEAGKMEIVNGPINAYEVTEGITTMSRALAATKDIIFESEIGEMKNPYVYADELHTNQVIINLISNAIKYTNPGGTVYYRIDQISDPENGIAGYRIAVKDNGIGMSEEFQKHLFESFSRENNATVSKQEGAGLGLAIVKKIVDLIGGTIAVKSRQGEGSVFTVELPLRVMDDPAIEEYEASKNRVLEVSRDPKLEGRRVLLVEDNEMNREIAAEILEETGMIIEAAEDGTIAVRKVKENGCSYYDFILMDIQMPFMNGYEATAEIRKLQDGENIPIIALSANAFKEDVDKSLAAGMNGHVAKPIDIKELYGELARFC